jgi:hypothetical protein
MPPGYRLGIAIILICAVSAGLVNGCGDVSATPTASPLTPTTAAGTEAPASADGLVSVDGALTEVAQVGGEIKLNLAVTNVGPRDIHELAVVISDAYLANLTVLDTVPSATRHNEQGGEYFIFGALARGQTHTYQITMSPRVPGQYDATVFLTDMTPTEIKPLLLAGGGEAKFTDTTSVVPR